MTKQYVIKEISWTANDKGWFAYEKDEWGLWPVASSIKSAEDCEVKLREGLQSKGTQKIVKELTL